MPTDRELAYRHAEAATRILLTCHESHSAEWLRSYTGEAEANLMAARVYLDLDATALVDADLPTEATAGPEQPGAEPPLCPASLQHQGEVVTCHFYAGHEAFFHRAIAGRAAVEWEDAR